MNACDIAWAAGLFEGEGSITCRKGSDGEIIQMVMSLTMVDEDVVERFCEVVGCGTVAQYFYGPNKDKIKYQWYTGKSDTVVRLFSELQPYLGKRRTNRGLEIIQAYYASRRPRLVKDSM